MFMQKFIAGMGAALLLALPLSVSAQETVSADIERTSGSEEAALLADDDQLLNLADDPTVQFISIDEVDEEFPVPPPLEIVEDDTHETEAGELTILSEEEPPTEIVDETDLVAPTVLAAESKYQDQVVITFSEEVLLPSAEAEIEFTIQEEFDSTQLLEVLAAEVDEDEPTQVVLITEPQIEDVGYTITVSANIVDLVGNPIVSGITDTATFVGSDKIRPEEESDVIEPEKDLTAPEEDQVVPEEIPEPDVLPPEDITRFLLSFEKELDKFLIKMTWTASLNSAGDLIDQILYTSMNQGLNYDPGQSLGPTASSYDLHDMEGGQEYTFKITTKDVNGNESVGIVKSIRLPQTGPLTTLALSLGFLGAGAWGVRQSRKK